MEFSKTSEIYSLNKFTYIKLRWIAYIGQLIAILFVKFVLQFDFKYFICITIIFLSSINCSIFSYWRNYKSFYFFNYNTSGI